MANVNHDAEKERIASRLRANVPPWVVMAEVRLREVVNGSPGRIVQVDADDLRNILLEYARLWDAARE